ncbi:MAG: hypothetical protein JNM17_40625 [Archangium sp.]|nr:hypothetical protein [Archangium sp.]
MVFALLIASSLAASPEASESVARERASPRFHGELSLAGGFGLSQPAIGYGPGVYVEAGIVVDDAHTVALRGSLITLVSIGVLQGGLIFSERIGEHVTVGGGIAWTFISGIEIRLPTAAAIHIPMRFTFLIGEERSTYEIARRGFTIGIEFAPGIAYAKSNGLTTMPAPVQERLAPDTPDVSISALLTIGYAAW